MKIMNDKITAMVHNDLKPEYRFDYKKARPNRFAQESGRLVLLDTDVAEVFTEPEQVNAVLRALIATMPKQAAG